MRIGELAARAGTTTRALRFYESLGLLEAPRTANGYREYGEEHIRLVKEILGLQAMGLSLDDTRPFVECLRAGNDAGDSCPDSIEVYRRKLAEVEACLDRLNAARADLLAKLASAQQARGAMKLPITKGSCQCLPHRCPSSRTRRSSRTSSGTTGRSWSTSGPSGARPAT